MQEMYRFERFEELQPGLMHDNSKWRRALPLQVNWSCKHLSYGLRIGSFNSSEASRSSLNFGQTEGHLASANFWDPCHALPGVILAFN